MEERVGRLEGLKVEGGHGENARSHPGWDGSLAGPTGVVSAGYIVTVSFR